MNYLHSFSVAAVTNHHKHADLEEIYSLTVLYYHLAEIKVLAGFQYSFSFSSMSSYIPYIPWFMAPVSTFKANMY